MLSRRTLLIGTASLAATAARASRHVLPVAATTSIADSGLGRWLAERYEALTGVELVILSNPSEQAALSAADGRAPVAIVNHPGVAANLVASGVATNAQPFMSNGLVIAGPRDDPARIAGMSDAAEALRTVARVKARFVSRADGSGTYAAELRLWSAARMSPPINRAGYIQANMGMRRTIDLAVAEAAYVLTDRATWLAQERHGDLTVLVEGLPELDNKYFLLRIPAAAEEPRRAALAERFEAWLLSDAGQRDIAAFRVGGVAPFVPLALRN
ncbi:substrate-binding domain-containing protein [Alsobacter sp. SYSU M60028]|uniref:Substrate-binding domain-containing protein n=1 Tax=Alsobacter ponti TaxID=2962936 RepID=A0ABT1LK84_9HYPH|nr:substrate-binding domain-containing protein [Alsobacter ponti]MCP8941150.1 substrate-binding domain-containing protein [Alsobacter ponti]